MTQKHDTPDTQQREIVNTTGRERPRISAGGVIGSFGGALIGAAIGSQFGTVGIVIGSIIGGRLLEPHRTALRAQIRRHFRIIVP